MSRKQHHLHCDNNSLPCDLSDTDNSRHHMKIVVQWGIPHRQNLFTIQIIEYYNPKSLEKPPKLETYNCTEDLDEHVEHVDIVLDHHQAIWAVKCKLFSSPEREQPWLGSNPLENDSDNFLKTQCDEFKYYFITQKC